MTQQLSPSSSKQADGFASGNPIITHNGMEAEVILASQGPEQRPIYTLRVRTWRGIWAEIMTHRVFGRNARSSRAVPFKTLATELRQGKGFTPDHWTGNQPGMQGLDDHNGLVFLNHTDDHWETREDAWQMACNNAASYAQAFANAGYHKQLANRLIEPFMMIDAVITSTDWQNFFWLREHAHAEPHLQDFARIVGDAIEASTIQQIQPGEWHLPYITNTDWIECSGLKSDANPKLTGILCKISAARCARVSYAPFDGNASYEKELERYDMLVSSDRVHASPLEHQATPDEVSEIPVPYWAMSSIIGTAGRGISQEDPDDPNCVRIWERAHLHGNLTGYLQNRKLVPNESHPD